MEFYKKMIKKHYKISDETKITEYLDFCLSELKNNIIYSYDNTNSTKAVITEIFKRAMVKKHTLDANIL